METKNAMSHGILNHLMTKGIIKRFRPNKTMVEEFEGAYDKKAAKELGPLIGFDERADKKFQWV